MREPTKRIVMISFGLIYCLFFARLVFSDDTTPRRWMVGSELDLAPLISGGHYLSGIAGYENWPLRFVDTPDRDHHAEIVALQSLPLPQLKPAQDLKHHSCPGLPGSSDIESAGSFFCDLSTRICSSWSWTSLTGEGASVIRQIPFCVFGKAITSRIELSPARSMTRRSSPKAIPPWGGAPYSRASNRNPNLAAASSRLIPRRSNIRD